MTSRTRRSIPFVRRLVASLLSAITVAAIAHVASVIAHFMANGATSDGLIQIHDYFLPGTLISFVLLAVGIALGGFRFWFTAVLVGFAASAIGGVCGTAIVAVRGGTAIAGDVIGVLLGTLSSVNLVLVVATIVAAVTAGRRVWAYVLVATPGRTGGAPRQIALVRPPAENLADGLVTHISREPIDSALAEQQWDNYVSALTDNGWAITDVEAAPTMADSVFVEDAVVIFGDTAVIANPGAKSRREETVAVEATVRELGLDIERIERPGTLDGGDVLKVGKTVYVGRGGRTNAEGIRQLRAIVSGRGYTVVAVPMTKALHLKTAATALPDGTVIGYPALIDDPSIFDRFLAVPEAAGTAVVVLSADTVLMAASAPKSAELIADLGYRVVTVDISEFEKLEGCVTCLSVRVR